MCIEVMGYIFEECTNRIDILHHRAQNMIILYEYQLSQKYASHRVEQTFAILHGLRTTPPMTSPSPRHFPQYQNMTFFIVYNIFFTSLGEYI